MARKSAEASWGGKRKRAGRKPLGERKRVHRSVTIDPDIYQCLILDTEVLQAKGLKAKVSDVLNCRLRKAYKQEPNNLIPADLDWARREKQETIKKITRRTKR